MDVKLVSSITRLANYMPLGSYVIYTALETYSFSLGTTPAPVTTVIETPTSNYTCYYYPGAGFTYTTCTDDQSSALIISLSIGFFLAVFLSFLKQVPINGTPPLADPPANNLAAGTGSGGGGGGGGVDKLAEQRPQRRKYRRGIVYAEGNFYYLDFGDSHVWGHAALSFVAFGTLSLFSASVSQCLFPSIKPWIFVFTQIILLVICCFIAMFWVDDPTLSIGLMVVPQTDSYPTQTSGGSVNSPSGAPATSAAAATTYNASTSTTALPLAATASGQPGQSTALSSNGMTFALASDPSRTSAGLANVALANNVMNSAMASTSALSSATTAVGGGGGVGRTSLQAKRTATMSSVNEKQGYVDQEDGREWYGVGVYEESEEAVVSASVPASATSSDYGVVKDEMGHLSLKME